MSTVTSSSTGQADQVEGPIAVPSEEWRCRRLAAWSLGGQLARLRFWLSQAWLMVYHGLSCRLAERAEAVWIDLALTVREVVQRIQARDHLCQAVRVAHESWTVMFHSAWHVDAVWDTNAAIGMELARHPEMSERVAREEGCEDLLRTIDRLLAELQSEIEGYHTS